MKYNQPWDQPGAPNAPYVDGDPLTGTEGSILPAAAAEFPQREIVSVIAFAQSQGSGMAPDNADLQQLRKAIDYLFVVRVNTTLTVGSADFPTINSALDWLYHRRVARDVKVKIALPASQIILNGLAASIKFDHPDAQRITIEGAALTGVFPANTELAQTGYAARVADGATNLGIYRARIASEIRLINGARFDIVTGLGMLKNVLISSDGTSDLGLSSYSGDTNIETTVVHGFSGRGIVLGSGFIAMSQVISSLNGSLGIVCDDGGNVQCYGEVTSIGNGGAGYYAQVASSIRVAPGGIMHALCNNSYGFHANSFAVIATNNTASKSNRNNGSGFVAAGKGSILCGNALASLNAGVACFASEMAYINCGGMDDPLGANTTGAFQAFNMSLIVATGHTVAGGLSPAANTPGNGNALIVV